MPTRELAQQIGDMLQYLIKGTQIKHAIIIGGQPIDEQINIIESGIDIIIATPGRLVDIIQKDRVDLSTLKMCVLDEADRMLDLGFSKDLSYLRSKLPTDTKVMLFSSTMSDEIKTRSHDL